MSNLVIESTEALPAFRVTTSDATYLRLGENDWLCNYGMSWESVCTDSEILVLEKAFSSAMRHLGCYG